MKQITDRLVKMIVHEFKSQVKNRYDFCVQNDYLANFKKQYLLKGTVGQLKCTYGFCSFSVFGNVVLL